jgi:hypothetical protein
MTAPSQAVHPAAFAGPELVPGNAGARGHTGASIIVTKQSAGTKKKAVATSIGNESHRMALRWLA